MAGFLIHYDIAVRTSTSNRMVQRNVDASEQENYEKSIQKILYIFCEQYVSSRERRPWCMRDQTNAPK